MNGKRGREQLRRGARVFGCQRASAECPTPMECGIMARCGVGAYLPEYWSVDRLAALQDDRVMLTVLDLMGVF